MAKNFLDFSNDEDSKLPPIPMRLDYPANVSAESPEDNLPALPADPEQDALDAASAQYKLAPGNAHGVVTPGPHNSDMDELDAQLAKNDVNDKSRLDGEMSDADAMQSPFPETEGPEQARMPAADGELSLDNEPMMSPQEKLLSTYQQYKNAQDEARKKNQNLGILSGFNKVAQGMASGYGGKIDDDAAGIKELMALNNQKPEDLAARIKIGGDEMNDPKSDISKFMREQAYGILKKLNPAADYHGQLDNMSAEQLQKLPGLKNALSQGRQGFTHVRDKLVNGHPLEQEPSTGKYYDGITGEVVTGDPSKFVITDSTSRKDPLDEVYRHVLSNSGIMGQPVKPVEPSGKAAPTADPVTGDVKEQKEYTLDDLNKSQTKNYDKIVIPTMKEAKQNPTITALNKINQAASTMLAKLEPDPKTGKVDSGNLAAARAQFATMSTGGQATDSAMHEIQGAGGSLNQLEQALRNLEGEITPQNLEFFKKAAYKFQKAAEQSAVNATQPYVDTVKAAYPGLPLADDNVRKMLGIQNQMRNSAVEAAKAKDAAKSTSNSNEVKRMTSDGKIAIFDAKTKKFLRYEN